MWRDEHGAWTRICLSGLNPETIALSLVSLTSHQRQTLIWAAVGALLLWALAALGPVLTPFVAGGILAYVLQPGVAWLAQRRVPRAIATSLVLLLSMVALTAIALVLVPIVQTEIGQIRRQFPALAQAITEEGYAVSTY